MMEQNKGLECQVTLTLQSNLEPETVMHYSNDKNINIYKIFTDIYHREYVQVNLKDFVAGLEVIPDQKDG